MYRLTVYLTARAARQHDYNVYALTDQASTLVAKKKRIKLDKTNVEKVLYKKIKTLSFKDQYEAFSGNQKRNVVVVVE